MTKPQKKRKLKRKVKIAFVLFLFLLVTIPLGVLSLKPEVVLRDEANYLMEELAEYESLITGNTDFSNATAQNPYDLESYICSLSSTDISGFYTRNSTSVTCIVKAPDVYSYLTNHMDDLLTKDSKDIYQSVVDYVSSPDCPIRKTEVELYTRYEDGVLYANTDSLEYKDAASGGFYSAVNEAISLIYSNTD